MSAMDAVLPLDASSDSEADPAAADALLMQGLAAEGSLDADDEEEGGRGEGGEEGGGEARYAQALDRPRAKVASYLTSHSYNAEPANDEDHTFSGIMFCVRCKATLPVEYMQITHFHIRGEMGPVSVYSTERSFHGKEEAVEEWKLHFRKQLRPAYREFQEVELVEPIRITPGSSVGVYIHSTLPGDQALVYSEQRGRITLEDRILQILPGVAHVSNRPFHPVGPWGGWSSWRQDREFCGKMTYGVKYKLWSPECNRTFPASFQELVHTLMLCHRSNEGLLNMLPDDALYTILHLCSWDWAGEETVPDDKEPEPDADGSDDDIRRVYLPRTRVTTREAYVRGLLRTLARFEGMLEDDDDDGDYSPDGDGDDDDDDDDDSDGDDHDEDDDDDDDDDAGHGNADGSRTSSRSDSGGDVASVGSRSGRKRKASGGE